MNLTFQNARDIESLIHATWTKWIERESSNNLRKLGYPSKFPGEPNHSSLSTSCRNLKSEKTVPLKSGTPWSIQHVPTHTQLKRNGKNQWYKPWYTCHVINPASSLRTLHTPTTTFSPRVQPLYNKSPPRPSPQYISVSTYTTQPRARGRVTYVWILIEDSVNSSPTWPNCQ